MRPSALMHTATAARGPKPAPVPPARALAMPPRPLRSSMQHATSQDCWLPFSLPAGSLAPGAAAPQAASLPAAPALAPPWSAAHARSTLLRALPPPLLPPRPSLLPPTLAALAKLPSEAADTRRSGAGCEAAAWVVALPSRRADSASQSDASCSSTRTAARWVVERTAALACLRKPKGPPPPPLRWRAASASGRRPGEGVESDGPGTGSGHTGAERDDKTHCVIKQCSPQSSAHLGRCPPVQTHRCPQARRCRY
jgi:hypothetical protein